MRISEEKIQEINDKVDILDLVTSYGIKLQRSGKGYKGLCPFHNDSNPSFHVSLEKKIAKCMSCGEGGLPITFVSKMENISFMDATIKLSKRYDIRLDIESNYNKEKEKNAKYYEIMNFAMDFYTNFLYKSLQGEKALNYLHNRRLNDETIKRFNIGLSPKKDDALSQTLINNGYLLSDLTLVGLAREYNGKIHDTFINRIMFPILDENGNIVGFSGRKYDDESKDSPKYVNTEGTVLFKKSNLLYNLNNAKNDIKKKNRIVLFEGFMDVIASYNAGITEGVCSMGTALTSNHIALMKRYTNNIIVCYDGDDAGINATYKAISILNNLDMNVKILSLNEGLDPDEYIGKYGSSSFINLFDNELIDAVDFKYFLAKKGKNFNNIREAESFKMEIFNLIKTLNSNLAKEKYLNRLASDLGVTNQIILLDYNSYSNSANIIKKVEKSFDNEKKNKLPESRYQKAEKMLLLHMMSDKNKAFNIEYLISDLEFEDQNHELRIQLVDYYYHNHDIFDINLFIDELRKQKRDDLVLYFENAFQNIEICSTGLIQKKEIDDLILQVKKANKLKQIAKLKKNALNVKTDEEKSKILSEQLKNLQDIKK